MFLEEFMHEIEKRWNEIKEAVRMERELSDVAYNTWIAPLQVFKVESNVVTVLIPSYQIHSLDYISKKFKFDFKVAVSEMMDSEYDIEFILENEKLKKEQVVETSPVYNLNYENAKLHTRLLLLLQRHRVLHITLYFYMEDQVLVKHILCRLSVISF